MSKKFKDGDYRYSKVGETCWMVERYTTTSYGDFWKYAADCGSEASAREFILERMQKDGPESMVVMRRKDYVKIP
jgi:hypothetical protein